MKTETCCSPLILSRGNYSQYFPTVSPNGFREGIFSKLANHKQKLPKSISSLTKRFNGDDFSKIDQTETRIPFGSHVC